MINTKDDRMYALCFIGFIIWDIICSYYVVHAMLSVWHKSQSIMFYPCIVAASIAEISYSYLPEYVSNKFKGNVEKYDRWTNLTLYNILCLNPFKFVKLLLLRYFMYYVIFIKLSSYYKSTQYLHYMPIIVMPILKTLCDKRLYS